MTTVTKKLFTLTDNSPLVLFRVLFGLVLFAESLMDLLDGRVRNAFIVPHYRFPFIGFEFLRPLSSNGMYYVFGLMAALAILITIGAFYRPAMAGFTLLWAYTYLVDKPGYQNHYYLMLLLCCIMVFMPANRSYSVDAHRNPEIRSLTCPRWVSVLFITQTAIVFFYSGVNKLYPDWLNGTYVSIVFGYKSHMRIVGPLLKQHWLQWAVTYGGILFDLLIVPALLWKPTRKSAFILAIIFNLFNFVVFRIGVFPLLALSLSVFFFEPEQVRSMFFKSPNSKGQNPRDENANSNPIIVCVLGLYFLMQALLPLRHLLYPGNTMWTEEGSRLSWRMMLRIKTGNLYYKVVDPISHEEWQIDPKAVLTRPQAGMLPISPDMIWQFAQQLKSEFAQKGFPKVEIYAIGTASLNKHDPQPLVNPHTNLAKVQWSAWKHSTWIVPNPAPLYHPAKQEIVRIKHPT